ncbi:branched-chain amino acid transport system II carrier protein [Bacillus atrophaeus]|uniref:branched-chain amino acid transport system II carrier protein n=1 Tax=Bacillus atrophaeus TaxID=1452 RepID=UPI0022813008|nr:branched-chain amino acid transport system II carrier protein [Bacillus atrophaeus]MCY8931217.1 branched-chain amino acid transport system II carrier protein [Bacillus atrophaeus]MCY8944511.1 branched-chain amino acid transport system II carrier protein [Bacillus atrophaeus]
MKQTLPVKETVIIGFMLFALFFGAGNMIYPPELGQAAGHNVWKAIGGFLLTGVGLPLLGIIAIALTGKDAKGLADKAHPVFGTVFTVVLYLSIGPLFAIPRTGTVSYEIGAVPFLTGIPERLSLFVFTLLFFGITYYLAINPSKVVDRVGKILTPIKFTIISVIVIKAIITPMGHFGAAQQAYTATPLFKGFLEGYKTMDALASIVFGVVVVNAVKSKGVTNSKALAAACIKAGIIAALGLTFIYVALAYLGATSIDAVGPLGEGAKILSASSSYLFGSLGNIVLGAAITVACLTTSIGLVTSCGDYFSKLIPKLSYKMVVTIVILFSLIISNFGLAQIIAFSVPILSAIYPLAIVIILLSFIDKLFKERREVYIACLITTGMFSLIDGLKAASIPLGSLDKFLNAHLPLYSLGIGWVLPAVAGALIGYILTFFISPAKQLVK